MFESISKINNEVISNLYSVASAIREISSAISEMPENKIISFVNVFENIGEKSEGVLAVGESSKQLTNLSNSVQTLEPKSIEATKELVNQAIRYRESQTEIQMKTVEPLMELINTQNKFSSTSVNNINNVPGKQKERVLQPIQLMIGDRILKKFVIDVMNTELNPRKI
jgi:hypothetical protein